FVKQDDFSYLLDFDYIINCIGIIKPYCKDTNPIGKRKAILVNALFPHILSTYCKKKSVKLMQIATDCAYSGKYGNYDEYAIHDAEDVYGKTKSLGEVYDQNMLNIRCSIIGPELQNNLGLLEWFLHQDDKIPLQGFSNHKWNGVTTLQFAKLCLKIIENNKFSEFIKNSNLYHFTPNNTVSKYELLKLFQEVFKKNITVNSAESKNAIDRTLTTKYPQFTDFYGREAIRDSLLDLNDFMKINYK
ncbi:MAG: sugar nucleotide-binding protein, partial [Candidatus Parcubacteria bacterium]|nr:sugar nucleotide-binding protein [Candidatus Parcubacteria bacterium]